MPGALEVSIKNPATPAISQMRILVCRVNPYFLSILRLMHEAGHKITHAILDERLSDLARGLLPTTELIASQELWRNLRSYAGDRGVDPELIRNLRPHEPSTLAMLDRMNRWGASIQALQHTYLNAVSATSRLLDRAKPDLVIFLDVPHTGLDHCLYCLARRAGVPTKVGRRTELRDRIFVGDSIGSFAEFSPEDSVSHPGASTSPEEHESEYLSTAAQMQRDPRAHRARQRRRILVPRDLTVSRIARDAFPHVDSLPDGIPEHPLSGLDRLYLRWKDYRAFRNARELHDRSCINAASPIPEHAVFFPLHIQPEATTLPLGNEGVHQINVARTLSAALPDGWTLFVKEHPASARYGSLRMRARSVQYYRELSEIPRVALLPLSADTERWMRGAQVVATVTGTPGWEARLRGKPVLAFGSPWYGGAPGVHVIRSTCDLAATFATLDVNALVENGDLADYIAFMMTLCNRGSIRRDYTGDHIPQGERQRLLESLLTVHNSPPTEFTKGEVT